MNSTLDLQRRLLALGFNPGPLDGKPGEQTKAAIAAFQEANGLEADGIAGKQTKAKLFPVAEPDDVDTAGVILTAAVIRKVCPSARADLVAGLVSGAARLRAAGVSTKLRAAHFLAQIATETGGLRAIEESLNYSAAGLRKTFGRHRISAADCEKHGRASGRSANQEAIANILYGGEWGRVNLGNTQPGDGWRYRGGGMMQTTGRSNYRAAGREDDPEALRQPGPALDTALHFWSSKGCSALADRDADEALRKRINGGTNGLAEMRGYLKKAKAALGA